MPEAIVPTCAECGRIIWPSEEAGARVFLWYAGDEADDPLKDELARGGITHAECAEGFSQRLNADSTE
jgi:hypothetical protein